MATVEQPALSFKTALQKPVGDITEALSIFKWHEQTDYLIWMSLIHLIRSVLIPVLIHWVGSVHQTGAERKYSWLNPGTGYPSAVQGGRHFSSPSCGDSHSEGCVTELWLGHAHFISFFGYFWCLMWGSCSAGCLDCTVTGQRPIIISVTFFCNTRKGVLTKIQLLKKSIYKIIQERLALTSPSSVHLQSRLHKLHRPSSALDVNSVKKRGSCWMNGRWMDVLEGFVADMPLFDCQLVSSNWLDLISGWRLASLHAFHV